MGTSEKYCYRFTQSGSTRAVRSRHISPCADSLWKAGHSFSDWKTRQGALSVLLQFPLMAAQPDAVHCSSFRTGGSIWREHNVALTEDDDRTKETAQEQTSLPWGVYQAVRWEKRRFGILLPQHIFEVCVVTGLFFCEQRSDPRKPKDRLSRQTGR